MFARVGVVLVLVAALGATATAQDRAKARELYRRGTQHYRLAEYDQALAAFKDAYREVEDPSLLFNIAQCHRLMGHNDDAVRFYRTYLHELPKAPNRDEVKQLIASLEAALKSDSAARQHPPQEPLAPLIKPEPATPTPPRTEARTEPPRTEPPRTTPRVEPLPVEPTRTEPPVRTIAVRTLPREPVPVYKRWWLWTAVGAVVVVGVGVGLGVGLTSGGAAAPAVTTTNGTFRPF